MNELNEPEQYLMLMFSMKGIGKRVDFNHVKEKINRDVKKMVDSEIQKILDCLIASNFIEKKGEEYGVVNEGMKKFAEIFPSIEEKLRKINEPWIIVYKAKQYYPYVADTVFEFCKDRMVGFYILFTEKRFFRRDFRGKKIILKSPKDLLFFVNMHYIDVIPCVHRIGADCPDWLVMDIDAGPKVPWERTKEVTEVCYKVFEKLSLNPALKFSGSRGFQIWSLIKKPEIPENYQPLVLRGESKRERNHFTLFSDFIRVIQQEVDKEIPKATTTDVGLKESRQDMILLDPSSMKPMGLVRAPLSVHSKTGLVSLPISVKELKKFEPNDATTEKTLERYKKKGNEFILKQADAKKLLDLLIK
jgi:DNA primase